MEYLIVVIAVIAFNVFAASAKKRGGAGDAGGGADMSGRSDSAGGSDDGGLGEDFDSDSGADSGGFGDEGYYSEAEMSRGDMENSGEDFDGAREFVERLKRERAESVRGGGMSAGGGAVKEESFGGNGKPFMYGGTLREVPEERAGEVSAGGFGEDAGSADSRDVGGSGGSGESRFDAELRVLRERSESLQNTLRSIRDFEEQNRIARGRGGAEGAYVAEVGSELRGADGSGSEEFGGLKSSGYGSGFFASKEDLRRAVLASEILGKPVSLGK